MFPWPVALLEKYGYNTVNSLIIKKLIKNVKMCYYDKVMIINSKENKNSIFCHFLLLHYLIKWGSIKFWIIILS